MPTRHRTQSASNSSIRPVPPKPERSHARLSRALSDSHGAPAGTLNPLGRVFSSVATLARAWAVHPRRCPRSGELGYLREALVQFDGLSPFARERTCFRGAKNDK